MVVHCHSEPQDVSLSDELRMCTGKALAVPAHKSIFTATEEGRKGETEDEMRNWNTEDKKK